MADLPPLRLPIQHLGLEGTTSRGCQLTGLYCVERPPDPGKTKHVSQCFRLPDGTTPDPNYDIRCGMCGHDMGYDVIVFLNYTWPKMKRAEAKLQDRRN